MNLTTSKYGKEWDLYFLRIAREVASNSKCLSRQIGAVLVKDKSVVSTGYCGPPRGVPTCDKRVTQRVYIDGKETLMIDGVEYEEIDWKAKKVCPRYALGAKSGERLDLCVSGHAEANVVHQAAREGISTKGGEIYCWCGLPCKNCCIAIVNSGISTIICLDNPNYDSLSEYIIREAVVSVVKYKEEDTV